MFSLINNIFRNWRFFICLPLYAAFFAYSSFMLLIASVFAFIAGIFDYLSFEHASAPRWLEKMLEFSKIR